jgi:hypothetical protein
MKRWRREIFALNSESNASKESAPAGIIPTGAFGVSLSRTKESLPEEFVGIATDNRNREVLTRRDSSRKIRKSHRQVSREKRKRHARKTTRLCRVEDRQGGASIDKMAFVYDKCIRGHFLCARLKACDPPVNCEIVRRNMSRGGSPNLGFDALRIIPDNKKS